MAELKPCPFCGMPGKLQTDFRYPRFGIFEDKRTQAFEVVCDNPRCPIYHADNTYFLTEIQAVKALNMMAEK